MQFETILPFLLLLLFPLFFIGLWVGVCLLLARIGGWSRLAVHYQSPTEFAGKKWHFQSGRLGWTNYKSSLIIGANHDGVYLAVLPFFRAGHPPLVIPWRDISTTEQKGWLFSSRDFTFAKVPTVRLRLLLRVGDQIMATQTDAESWLR